MYMKTHDWTLHTKTRKEKKRSKIENGFGVKFNVAIHGQQCKYNRNCSNVTSASKFKSVATFVN